MRAAHLAVVMLVACHRGGAPSGVEARADAAPDADRAARGEAPPDASDDEARVESRAEPPPPPTFEEATRRALSAIADEPLLAKSGAALREHFGDDASRPLAEQRASLAGGGTVLLLEPIDPRAKAAPFVLALDERGAPVWSKDRPTAGMLPPARELAIAARPDGGAALFAYDEPTRIVAARMWDRDGAAFADFQLFTTDACAALSAMYWPRRGWLVVAARPGGPRAQLLREDGTLAFGDGARVGRLEARAATPVTIVRDGDASWMLAQRAPAIGAPNDGPPDHLLVYRYDARGVPIWGTPVDVGVVDPRGSRIVAARVRDGVVRLETSPRVGAREGRRIEIDSSGRVLAR